MKRYLAVVDPGWISLMTTRMDIEVTISDDTDVGVWE